ncbi:MAG TPA: ABC transporter permease [Bryobacteraceae bacterium]|nr:ABC transporter permease [Bryobacteraceae bacterium]
MLWNDVRYALRLMRRSPGFTATAVLSLALGIGANTAIFSLLYTIMLRPLPVAHPEQLVQFLWSYPDDPRDDGYWSWDEFEHFRNANHVFSAMTGMSFNNVAAIRTEGSEMEPLILENIPGNYFQVLELKPAIGRLTDPDDVPASGDGDVVVVSWFFWDTRLHRDPNAIGKRIWYEDVPKTIVGVAPKAYTGTRVGNRTDVWMPCAKPGLVILGRLKPEAPLAQAQAEVNVLYHPLAEQSFARNRNPRILQKRVELEPAAAGLTRIRDIYGKSLILLMAAAGLLLLLACINMASLLLAKSAGRQRELAVRVGLGASRGRLVRQMLTESVLLSSAGTLVGVVLAYTLTGVLVRIMASGLVWQHVDVEVTPDLHLVLFTAGIALFTGLLFGLAPAWYAFRSGPASALRQTGHGGETWFWRLFGRGLVTAQVALSILLVTAASVFLGHLSHLRTFNLGFRSAHVLVVQLDPWRSGYKREQLAAPYQDLLARFEAIPGVRSASISGCVPLEGCGSGARFMATDEHVERYEDRRWTAVVWVAPRYFETMGIPLIAGRDFDFRDVGRPRVAIINQAMAKLYFPSGNAIGKLVRIDRDPRSGGWFGDDQPYEVVGVVGDVKLDHIQDGPNRAMYFNMFQESRLSDRFELRTSVDPGSVAPAARQAVREALKSVPVRKVMTMGAHVDATIVPERLIATLSEFFGGLGAVLAGVGLYGLLAYTVVRRTNEIGVRMALGAKASDVVRLVMRDALGMVCAGLLGGAAMVLWSRPLAANLVKGLQFGSIWPLALGGASMALVAMLASYVPVVRAARVDPMEALRHE